VSKLLDLSRPVESGMPVYPGDLSPQVEVCASHDVQGWGANSLHLGEHAGTHLDAPFHLIPDGQTVEQIPLARLTGQALAVDVSHRWPGQAVEVEDLDGVDLSAGDALILRTGAGERADFEAALAQAPGLSEGAAAWLVERGVRLVGTDAPSIDLSFDIDPGLLAHRQLLGAGVPVVENLVNLERLMELVRGRRFTLHTFPLRITGGSGSPVRAVAELPNV